MARAPYGPHTVTLILVVKGMVVGSPKIARARPDGRDGLRVGRPWSPHRANRGNSDPFCADGGNVALGARIGYTGRARSPPLGWALPTVSSGWWRERA